MKLFYSPFHNFIHKVLVTAHEAGLWDDIEFVPTFPTRNREGDVQGDSYTIAEINPLDKVPTLALDDGAVLFGSQTIVEYLDSQSVGRRLYPPDGPARWDALTRLAQADIMFDCTSMLVREGWQAEQRVTLFEWIWPKLMRGFDRFDKACARGFDQFDIGHAGMLNTLSYLLFRNEFYEAVDPLYPGYDWRSGRPSLEAWWDEATQRPSVLSHYKKDFVGDDSAAYCQAAVREVLKAQANTVTV